MQISLTCCYVMLVLYPIFSTMYMYAIRFVMVTIILVYIEPEREFRCAIFTRFTAHQLGCYKVVTTLS